MFNAMPSWFVSFFVLFETELKIAMLSAER